MNDNDRHKLLSQITDCMEHLTGYIDIFERDQRAVAAVGGPTPNAYKIAKAFYTTYHKLSECFPSYDDVIVSWCDLSNEQKQLWISTVKSLIHDGVI